MLKLVKDIINLKINLKEFSNYIINKDFNDINEIEIYNFLNSLNDEDKSLIILLILYFIRKIKFQNISSYSIDFLNSIVEESDSDLNKDIIWIFNYDNALLFSIDRTYFLINYNTKKVTLTLPKEIQNSKLFCLNCNHEMNFDETVSLDSYEFYILTK